MLDAEERMEISVLSKHGGSIRSIARATGRSRNTVRRYLCGNLKAGDVTETLTKALQASGLNRANVIHRPRLLSDNGSSYVAPALVAPFAPRLAFLRGSAAPRGLFAFKSHGIRSYSAANPSLLRNARDDHLRMIDALREGRRDDLVALCIGHLRPPLAAYIEAYNRMFGHDIYRPAWGNQPAK